MARHANTGMSGKKKPIMKIASLSIAGVLVASVVAALSLSANNARPFILDSSTIDTASALTDPHNTSIIMHIHVQLEIIAGDMKAIVPANIGIDPRFYKDHSLFEYGIKNPQMAPIHTHESSGLIHIESTEVRDFTMGDFLSIWGVNLDNRTISMTVDGQSIPDYKSHILEDGQKITLEVGI